MKKIYFLSLVLVIGVLFGALIITGTSILAYVDIASLIFVLVPAFLLLLASYGPKEMGRAFKSAFSGKTGAEVEKSIAFFTAMQRLFLLSGVLGTLIGVIAILSNLTDMSLVGRGFSVAILTIIYAIALTILVPVPFLLALKKRRAELSP